MPTTQPVRDLGARVKSMDSILRALESPRRASSKKVMGFGVSKR